MTLFNILKQTGLPVAYGAFETLQVPPYIAYIGSGQSSFEADSTYYKSENNYQIEYYYVTKDESKESEIEQLLLSNGYKYTKSEDTYIESDNIYVIYYNI